MKKSAGPPDWVWILLPLLFLVPLNLFPRPLQSERALGSARLSVERGRYLQAASQIERAAEMMPWRGDLWERAGSLSLQGGEPERAIPALTRAQDLGSLTLEGEIALGDAYQQTGDAERALKSWRGLVRGGVRDPEIYRRMVEVQSNQGLTLDAAQTLRDWLSFKKNDPAVIFEAGLYISLTDIKEGLPLLLRAASLNPEYEPRARSLQTSLNTADLQEDGAYRKLLIGRGYGAIEEWLLAEAAFRQAIEIQPDYAEAWALLGESLQQQGRNGFAELDRARNLNPDSTLVNVLYALYWQRAGKPDRAVQALEEIIRKEPLNPTWQIELANAYAGMGKINEALAHYQRATELDSQSSSFWQALASFSILYNLDVTGIGLPAARKAAALAPDDPASQDIMGQALLKIGDLNTAERFFERALEHNPEYAPALLHLGILNLHRGETQRAKTYLENALSQAGDGPTGKQAQRLLQAYYPSQ